MSELVRLRMGYRIGWSALAMWLIYSTATQLGVWDVWDVVSLLSAGVWIREAAGWIGEARTVMAIAKAKSGRGQG